MLQLVAQILHDKGSYAPLEKLQQQRQFGTYAERSTTITPQLATICAA